MGYHAPVTALSLEKKVNVLNPWPFIRSDDAHSLNIRPVDSLYATLGLDGDTFIIDLHELVLAWPHIRH